LIFGVFEPRILRNAQFKLRCCEQRRAGTTQPRDSCPHQHRDRSHNNSPTELRIRVALIGRALVPRSRASRNHRNATSVCKTLTQPELRARVALIGGALVPLGRASHAGLNTTTSRVTFAQPKLRCCVAMIGGFLVQLGCSIYILSNTATVRITIAQYENWFRLHMHMELLLHFAYVIFCPQCPEISATFQMNSEFRIDSATA
jgi:hypothetical protein